MYKIKYYIEDDIVREETCSDLDEACDTALAFDCPEFDASSSEDDSCYVGVFDTPTVKTVGFLLRPSPPVKPGLTRCPQAF